MVMYRMVKIWLRIAQTRLKIHGIFTPTSVKLVSLFSSHFNGGLHFLSRVGVETPGGTYIPLSKRERFFKSK